MTRAEQRLHKLGLDSEAQNSSEKLEMLACVHNPNVSHSEAAGEERRLGQKQSGQQAHGVAATRKMLFAPN